MFFSRQIGLSNGQTIPVLGGRSGHRKSRAVRHRRAQHRDAERSRRRRQRDQLLGRSPQARHPAPQQRGHHCHGAKAQWRRHQHDAGCRYQHPRVREYHRARLLRAHRRRWLAVAGGELSWAVRLCRRSVWPGRRTPAGRSGVRAGGGLHAPRGFPPRSRVGEVQPPPEGQSRDAEAHLAGHAHLRHRRERHPCGESVA